MASLTIHVGDGVEDMGARMLAAVERAEAGEIVSEEHLTFDSFATLAKLLTPKRLELLRYLHQHPAASIRSLSVALGRDYKRVHDDVTALVGAGLIERHDDDSLLAPFDELAARIAI